MLSVEELRLMKEWRSERKNVNYSMQFKARQHARSQIIRYGTLRASPSFSPPAALCFPPIRRRRIRMQRLMLKGRNFDRPHQKKANPPESNSWTLPLVRNPVIVSSSKALKIRRHLNYWIPKRRFSKLYNLVRFVVSSSSSPFTFSPVRRRTLNHEWV